MFSHNYFGFLETSFSDLTETGELLINVIKTDIFVINKQQHYTWPRSIAHQVKNKMTKNHSSLNRIKSEPISVLTLSLIHI